MSPGRRRTVLRAFRDLHSIDRTYLGDHAVPNEDNTIFHDRRSRTIEDLSVRERLNPLIYGDIPSTTGEEKRERRERAERQRREESSTPKARRQKRSDVHDFTPIKGGEMRANSARKQKERIDLAPPRVKQIATSARPSSDQFFPSLVLRQEMR
jgi:hypothetical protein